MMRQEVSRLVGSCLRAAHALFLIAPVDRSMRESIDRLNCVSDRVIADVNSRSAAVDDLAGSR